MTKSIYLLRNQQKQLVNTPIDGRTAMHLAADYGQLEVLEYIASQGADINAKDKHGISVILAAIWEGHANCVKFLLDKVLHTNHFFFCVKLNSIGITSFF